MTLTDSIQNAELLVTLLNSMQLEVQESTGKYRKWQEKQGEVKKDGGQRREKVGNGEKRRATARSFGQKLQEVSFLWDLFHLVCMPFTHLTLNFHFLAQLNHLLHPMICFQPS